VKQRKKEICGGSWGKVAKDPEQWGGVGRFGPGEKERDPFLKLGKVRKRKKESRLAPSQAPKFKIILVSGKKGKYWDSAAVDV